MYEAEVTVHGRVFKARVHLDGERIAGTLTGTKEVKVLWIPGAHSLPWVSHPGWGAYPPAGAKELARDILLEVSKGVICGNPETSVHTPGTHPTGDLHYVSRLLKAGHVRKPTWVHTSTGVYIRASCIVNPEKLTPEELRENVALRDTFNALSRAWGRPLEWDELRRHLGQ